VVPSQHCAMIDLQLAETPYLQDEQGTIESPCSSTFQPRQQITAHLPSLTEHKHPMCGSLFHSVSHRSKYVGACLVLAYLEVPILVPHNIVFKPYARDVDNSRTLSSPNNLPDDQFNEEKVADMVQTKLHLNAIFGRLEGRNGHHTSTVDQIIDLFNTGIDP
jgi:hypothetical protein